MALTQTPRSLGQTPIASILIVAAAIAVAVALVPSPPQPVAAPLAPGTHELALPEGAVTIDVGRDGDVALTTPEDVVVTLAYDDRGRVLDELRVESPRGGHHIGVDVDETGRVRMTRRVEMTDTERSADAEELVTTVARCAPRGEVARDQGWPSHGTIVSSAASNLRLDLTVRGPDGDPEAVAGDFVDIVGARTFCARVAELTDDPAG